MSGAELWMTFLAIMLMVAVAGVLRNLGRYNRRNDRAATAYAVATIVIFVFFAWAQHHAERDYELKHTAEHRAVQEQVKSLQNF